MEKDRRVYLDKSLQDLKQKLNALDHLMHSGAKQGGFTCNGFSRVKKYGNVNLFTSLSNTAFK